MIEYFFNISLLVCKSVVYLQPVKNNKKQYYDFYRNDIRAND